MSLFRRTGSFSLQRENWLGRLGWGLAACGFGLGLWQAIAWDVTRRRGIPFPTPVECARALGELLAGTPYLDHSIYHHLYVSFERWVEGFGLGLGGGLAHAFLVGWWRPLRRITMPTVEVLQVVPGLAWIPVAILLFGLNHTATVASCSDNVSCSGHCRGYGIHSVDKRYIRAGGVRRQPVDCFATVFCRALCTPLSG
jgi:ABC-type nitrate/sulfonate/bicarbonate transport system permease component